MVDSQNAIPNEPQQPETLEHGDAVTEVASSLPSPGPPSEATASLTPPAGETSAQPFPPGQAPPPPPPAASPSWPQQPRPKAARSTIVIAALAGALGGILVGGGAVAAIDSGHGNGGGHHMSRQVGGQFGEGRGPGNEHWGKERGQHRFPAPNPPQQRERKLPLQQPSAPASSEPTSSPST